MKNIFQNFLQLKLSFDYRLRTLAVRLGLSYSYFKIAIANVRKIPSEFDLVKLSPFCGFHIPGAVLLKRRFTFLSSSLESFVTKGTFLRERNRCSWTDLARSSLCFGTKVFCSYFQFAFS
jgi:hypothetical protein